MAKTLTGTVTASLKYTYSNNRTIATTSEPKTIEQSTSYTNGDGANQAGAMYSQRYTLTAASPNQDIDLYDAVSDIFGDTLNFELVKAFIVKNLASASGDNIYVGALGVANALTGPWGGDADGKNKVNAGGSIVINAPLDGYPVETNQQYIRLQYQGTSGSISVDFAIIGVTGDLESSSSSSSSLSSSSSSSSSSYSSSSSSSSSSVSSSSSSSVAFSSSSSLSSSSSSSSSYSSSSQSSQSLSSSSSLISSASTSSSAESSSSSSSSSMSSASSQG